MHRNYYKRKLCGSIRAAGRDVGQWFSPGDRIQYIEGVNQATQYFAHHSEYCYRQIQVSAFLNAQAFMLEWMYV